MKDLVYLEDYKRWVCSNGRIFREDKKGNIVECKLTTNSEGYKVMCVRYKGKKKNVKVHRLIAMAFIPNPENKPCIDHINRIKDDNRVENLRWVTYIENNNNLSSNHNPYYETFVLSA